jgi:hypothetical protein
LNSVQEYERGREKQRGKNVRKRRSKRKEIMRNEE